MDYTIYNGEPKLHLNKNESVSDDEDGNFEMDQLIKENLKDEEESLLWDHFFTWFFTNF